MSTIDLKLPSGAVRVGELRDDMAPAELDQDILQVRLPNGNVIDVGWSPEYDPHGRFVILVVRDDWDQPRASVEAATAAEAAQIVELLARAYFLDKSVDHPKVAG